VALLKAVTILTHTEIGQKVGISHNSITVMLRKPNVRRHIAELIAQREAEIIRQSVAYLLDEQRASRAILEQRKEATRERDRLRKLGYTRQGLDDPKAAGLRQWHAEQRARKAAQQVSDNENG
jgi:hypothetical protein